MKPPQRFQNLVMLRTSAYDKKSKCRCKVQGDVLAGSHAARFAKDIVSSDVTFTAPEIKRGIWPFMVMAGLFRVMPKRQGLD